MVRTLIAGAAVAGALTLGLAGASGAASTGGGGTGAVKPSLCARLPKLESQVHTRDSRAATRLSKFEAGESKAKAAGKIKAANAIGRHISRVQARLAKVNAGLAKAEATCGTSGASASAG